MHLEQVKEILKSVLIIQVVIFPIKLILLVTVVSKFNLLLKKLPYTIAISYSMPSPCQVGNITQDFFFLLLSFERTKKQNAEERNAFFIFLPISTVMIDYRLHNRLKCFAFFSLLLIHWYSIET